MGMGLGTLGSRFGRLGNAPSKGVGEGTAGQFTLLVNGQPLWINGQQLRMTYNGN